MGDHASVHSMRPGGFTASSDDVRIDRLTEWGNPYIIGRDGSREDVVTKYVSYAKKQFNKEELAALHGKKLWCWCAPLACHGDVLSQLAEEAWDEIAADEEQSWVEPSWMANEICEKLTDWWNTVHAQGGELVHPYKSNLLSRLIYGGESPSQTPCPVHKGRWSGISFGWPTQPKPEEPSGRAEVNEMLQDYYDRGCRCFQHRSCNDTTGWQPDEFCGCEEKKDG